MKFSPKSKEKKIRQKPGQILRNNWRMIRAVAKYIPQYPFLMILEGLIWGALNSASALFTIRLFNQLDDPKLQFGNIALTIGVMALFYLCAYIFDAWYWQYYNTTLFQKLQYNMQREMYEKALSVDLACYDDPEFYNDYVFAMDQARNKAWEVTENIGKIINRLIATAAVLGAMATISPAVAILLAVYAALNFILRNVSNKLSYKKTVEQKPMHRKNSYVNRQFHLADAAKELRISKVSTNLTSLYDDSVDEIVKSDIRYGKKLIWIDMAWSLLEVGGLMGILSLSLVQLVNGDIQMGGFAAAVTAMWNVSWTLSNLIERFQKFPEQSLYIEKYLKFLSWEPTIKSGDRIPDRFESLTFHNVSFAYPFGEQKTVLSNVNLTVRCGERIALVGYNGAGKTTLTKLLMRLYDPTEGEILYNGINIREFDLTAYRQKIGTVFQDFKIFAATIGENVMNGPYSDADRETVTKALQMATFGDKLNELPNGVDTQLTKEFCKEGVNLSGGESQKVAIARIFARKYELIVMDEPSSALDPMAEYQLNHSILDSANKDGRTVVFISHRLSTTRMADRIYMFANGSIIEEGSHDALMQLGGEYAEMFNLQAEKYRDKQTT
ncbi:MAG: ABC transporter ATP-binding protein [Clostridia bacterium]|nr:ABC transporter ATP-binding protein [Clostridia bacterium]